MAFYIIYYYISARSRGIKRFLCKQNKKKIHVTAQSQMLHGTVFDADSTEESTYTPPLHFRCRSTLLPRTNLDEYDDSQLLKNRD